jgi:hypothetical protein
VGAKATIGRRAHPPHTATADSDGGNCPPPAWSRSTARRNGGMSSEPFLWASAVQNARFGPIAVASTLASDRFSPSFSY